MEHDVLLVAGVPISLLIVGLVEAAKRAGLPSRYAGLAAIGIGVALFVAGVATQTWPEFTPWWEAIIAGVIAGLTASGIYSGMKAVTREKDGSAETPTN